MLNKTVQFQYPREIIFKYLKLFIQERKYALKPAGDIEPVHRMRVASRRLRAVLSVFKSILPKQKAKLWKIEISKVGQALGRAREIDVHIAFLRKIKQVDTGEIIKYLEKRRRQAQKQIEMALTGFEVENNLPGLEAYLLGLSSGEHGRFIDLPKSEIIQERLDKLLEFSRYVPKPQSIDELHRMRIAAKNLRYSLEILKPWYGKKIDKYIRASRDIQDALGDVHELDDLIKLLTELETKGKKDKPALKYLLRECLRLRSDYYNKFVQLWRNFRKVRLWPGLSPLIR